MTNRRAFTLVEVMIVIAILAALAAILFPVLSRAKNSGNESVCVQRMRQFHLAVSIYREEWNGVERGTPSQMGLPYMLGKTSPGFVNYARCTVRRHKSGESSPVESYFAQSWPLLDGWDDEAPARWELKRGGPHWFEMLEALGNQSPMCMDILHPDQFPVSRRSVNRALAVTFDGNLVQRRRLGDPEDVRFWFR